MFEWKLLYGLPSGLMMTVKKRISVVLLLHEGHSDGVVNHPGPCFQKSDAANCAAVIPRVVRSAGFSADGQYPQSVFGNCCLIKFT